MNLNRSVVFLALVGFLALYASLSPTIAQSVISVTPTAISSTLMRGGPGAFNAPREGGKKHTGVDIVANQSSSDKEIYRVKAVGAGIVAYARVNGSDEKGFGYTVIIDHQNGFYTQYSHLAIRASAGLVKLGDSVKAGQTIGYLADLKNGEMSSGNVRADVVKPYDKIQLHFEVFEAPKGRSSTDAIAPIKKDYTLGDPTVRLKGLNYGTF